MLFQRSLVRRSRAGREPAQEHPSKECHRKAAIPQTWNVVGHEESLPRRSSLGTDIWQVSSKRSSMPPRKIFGLVSHGYDLARLQLQKELLGAGLRLIRSASHRATLGRTTKILRCRINAAFRTYPETLHLCGSGAPWENSSPATAPPPEGKNSHCGGTQL